MKILILLTGANGHVGQTLARMLSSQGYLVRGLVLPGDDISALDEMGVETFFGDVRDPSSLRAFFSGAERYHTIVIHTAAVIAITSEVSPLIREVNVEGTRNVAEASLACNVHRFIYISSVHAIPEKPGRQEIVETREFSANTVRGGYAKTKAEASAYIMECWEKRGLPAIVLHPSGIIGPGDDGRNHIIAVIKAYMDKRLPAVIRAGYNLVDVRDVATATITAIEKGRVGETYILSGHHCELTYLLKITSMITGDGPRFFPVIPHWLARLFVPLIERVAIKNNTRPLATTYALDTLKSNDNFSHKKASQELGFQPRSIFRSLEGTVAWLQRK